MSSPAILDRDLKKYYGYKAAVDGVDLEVPRGSFFGFLGPNGAGKSTTIRMLTGLIPSDGGTVEILGFRLLEQELEIKRRIGLVPDESLLFDRLTGAEFLEFVGRMYDLSRPVAVDRARDLMDLFQLQADRKIIGEYSKGMRKRVADEGHSARPGEARRHHLSYLARAGSGGAAVRPHRHHQRWEDRLERHAGRAAARWRIAGGRVRAAGGREGTGGAAGLAMIVPILRAQLLSMRPGSRRNLGVSILTAVVWYGFWCFVACWAAFYVAFADETTLRYALPIGLVGICFYWQGEPVPSARSEERRVGKERRSPLS